MIPASEGKRHALQGNAVFLSASFPSGERGQIYRPYDPEAIADAVVAITRAVLYDGGRLVFGGHPTISPLVLLIAAELGIKGRVDIFQTRYFEGKVPPETLELDKRGYGDITWTETVHGDREASLEHMREQMLDRTDLIAGVFIGGMEGIPDEAELFAAAHANAWIVPIQAPGGAVRQVEPRGNLPNELVQVLTSNRYPLVAWRLVQALSRRNDG